MATTVHPPAARTSPDFLTFLKLELAPSPARWQATLRLTLACVVATIPIMVFHLHEPLLVVLLMYLFAKEDSTASAVGTLLAIIGFTIGLGLLLLYFMTVLDIVWLRVCLIPIVIAGTLYLNRILALGPLGTTIGLPLAIGMTLPDTLHDPEVLGRFPFWLWWAVVLGLVTNLGVQLLLNPADPRDTLARTLAQRLAAVEAAIAQALSGKPSLETLPARALAAGGLDGQLKLLKLAMLKHAALRRHRAELSALVSLVNRLVVAAATLEALLPLEITDADRARFVNVASACAAAREAVASLCWPDAATALEAASSANIPTAIAPLAEMEHLLAMLPLSLPGGAGAPTEVAPPAVHAGFFVPDALTNPEYRHFAIKGALAATICYLIYTGANYPAIYTSLITCVLCSVSTIGANVQKGTLRFSGAAVGGLLGVLTLVYVFPQIDSLLGFWIPFSAVTALAAYVNLGSPRISYFGFQIALAFFKCVLQGYGPRVSLTVARDRLIGIALGLTVFWIIDIRLWPVTAMSKIRERLSGALRGLATLASFGDKTSDDDGARIGEIRSRAFGDLSAIQQLLIETKFEPGLKDRSALEKVFSASQTALLFFAARSNPAARSARQAATDPVRMAWRRANETIADRLNYLADSAVGIGREPGPEPTTAIAEVERAMDESHLHTDAPLRGQLALDHRLVESISRISTAVQPGMS